MIILFMFLGNNKPKGADYIKKHGPTGTELQFNADSPSPATRPPPTPPNGPAYQSCVVTYQVHEDANSLGYSTSHEVTVSRYCSLINFRNLVFCVVIFTMCYSHLAYATVVSSVINLDVRPLSTNLKAWARRAEWLSIKKRIVMAFPEENSNKNKGNLWVSAVSDAVSDYYKLSNSFLNLHR